MDPGKTFEKRDELLQAALHEFSVKTFDEASLNDIIEQAGISKGTFYYHFENKQDLYLHLLEASARVKWEFISRKFPEDSVPGLEGKNMFETVRLLARAGIEFAAVHPEYYRLGQMFLREKGNRIYEEALDRLGGTTDAVIRGLVQKGKQQGDLRDDFPEDFLCRLVNHLFNHFYELLYGRDEPLDLERLPEKLDLFLEFLQNGMGRRAQS